MQKTTKQNIIFRHLMFQSIEVGYYKILAIEVDKGLDNLFRRTAIAAIIAKNDFGQWDEKTIHLIELKHCYNKYSKGPNKTPYEHLPGLILEITHISHGEIGDLDIVTWTLL